MAISWGPAQESGTNGARVGVDLSYTVSGATATVVLELWLWTKRASFGSSASYSRDGSFGSGSGSFAYNHTNNSSDWPTSNRTRIGSWSTTRTLQYGSTQSVSASGSVTGLGGSIPEPVTHSTSLTLPARTAASRPPAPPWATGTFVSDTQITVEWGHPAGINDPVYGIDGVQIERWDNDTGKWFRVANLTGKPTSWSDRGTRYNRVYRYRVRLTSSSAGTGDFAFTGDVHTTPMAPSNVQAVASSAGVQLTWSTNSAGNASAQEIQRQEDGGTWLVVGTGFGSSREEWLHADADPVKTHRYRVRALVPGPAGPSPWGTSNTVALASAPDAPTPLPPDGPWDATEPHDLTWLHVPTDGSGQERYEVRHRIEGATTWTTPAAVDSQVSAHTLPAGTYANGDSVEWQVRTWGVHPDPSPWSASEFTRPQSRPLVAINTPTDGATVDTSSVQVEWTADSQLRYRVTLFRDGQQEQVLSDTSPVRSRTIDGLANEQTYTVRVEVQRSSGLWSLPDEVTVTVAYVKPPAPQITAVDWDVELGATVVQINQPPWTVDTAEPVYLQVWRAIDDGPWLLIADQLPLDTEAVTDPVPAIGDGRVNHYRARAVSVLPSTADSAHYPLAVTTRMARGWVYLNGGPGLAQVCRVRAAARRRDSEGREKGARRYRGRPAKVLRTGRAHSLEWAVSALIAPNRDGASTRAEIVALQGLDGPVCYRDPAPSAPARWFGVMYRPDFIHQSSRGEVSWAMEQVDYVEGLAVEAGEGA